MKIAIMQPYVFPYLGYFQMINAVDKFVLLDDVNFIKKGWINRNQLLLNKQPYKITLPIIKASQNKLISELEINPEEVWRTKLLTTLQMAYKKAPYFSEVYPLLERILNYKEMNLSKFLHHNLSCFCNYLGIQTEMVPTSSIYPKNDLRGEDRIIDICNQEGATTYINAIGGQELYGFDKFKAKNIELNFIEMDGDLNYTQFPKMDFVPYLSIIDVTMFNSVEDTLDLLTKYTLNNSKDLF